MYEGVGGGANYTKARNPIWRIPIAWWARITAAAYSLIQLVKCWNAEMLALAKITAGELSSDSECSFCRRVWKLCCILNCIGYFGSVKHLPLKFKLVTNGFKTFQKWLGYHFFKLFLVYLLIPLKLVRICFLTEFERVFYILFPYFSVKCLAPFSKPG